MPPRRKVVLHTPKAHKYHTDGKPCGCWLGYDLFGSYKPYIACPYCGAAYNRDEVIEFTIWRCYDCGAGWYTDWADKYQKIVVEPWPDMEAEKILGRKGVFK